jgi:ubiquinone/menaquinone biosynthesis C-methylase UbiE
MSDLKIWTGERLETFVFEDTTVEHLHRYAITIDYIKGKTVLDIASGEGYGTNLLSKYAEKVFGVDIDETSIELAKKKYSSKNLEFKIGRADLIPLEDSSMDVVVSFETLEHHDKHQEMMLEIKRVLKPGGILIISTPDKKYYTDEANYKNPFHVKELYLDELKALLNNYFKFNTFFFQNVFNGSLVIPEKSTKNFKFFSGDFTKINEESSWKRTYIIAISSDRELSMNDNSSGFIGDKIYAIGKEQMVREISKEARDEGIEWIKKSWNYRIGNALLKPIRFFKK